MKIYLCGSHSCGKTTLAIEIARRYNFNVVSEAARDIISAQKIDLSSFAKNIMAADQFQADVVAEHDERQYAYTMKQRESGGNLVFDRGIDFLVYASMFSTMCHQQTKKYQDYIDHMKEDDVRVFVLDPHESKMEDDGVRKSMDMITAWSITNGIVLLLETHGIPYVRLTTPSLLERIKTVDAIIKWERS